MFFHNPHDFLGKLARRQRNVRMHLACETPLFFGARMDRIDNFLT
jgi:hypothetical protein